MHEIITLQLGQRANYLATHFWNTQESYFTYSTNQESLVDHDIHFRPGIGADGEETYTPRTLIYDLKGGFGSLRKFNALYDVQGERESIQALWDGRTQTQRQPSINQNEYQKSLDEGTSIPQLTAETVRYWSDFNRVYYNPKSIVQLNEYELNSQIMPFESWHAGSELFSTLDRDSDILDRDLRPFAEECDQLGGIQVFSGTDDAWGGFTASYVDKLRDEYGKASIWNWALEDTQSMSSQERLRKKTNVARSINEIAPQVSAYVRLACPPSNAAKMMRIVPNSLWYSSAVLAIAVESMTLPSRVKAIGGRQGALSDFEAVLNVQGNQSLFELGANVRDSQTGRATPSLTNGQANGHDQSTPTNLDDHDIDYTPSNIGEATASVDRVFARVEVTRDESHTGRMESEVRDMTDEWERRRRRLNAEPIVEKYDSKLEFPVIDSFPQDLITTAHAVKNFRVQATLKSTCKTRDRLRLIQRSIRGAIGFEEREALLNGLAEIGEQYQDGDDIDDSSGTGNDDDE
ncbi:MAG: hypothetical protein Q9160_006825 [Pyrenula sp. 1 TL-2023]